MAEVHHFAYGWINPILAYVLSFLGSLLGLVLTARSRDAVGAARLRWLTLAAVAIGGTGIWLMHFMAMLGFEIPAAALRYDVPTTIESLILAIVIVALGLYVVGFSRPATWKIFIGGAVTGVGVAAMHYTGMSALHFAGTMSYDPLRVTLSVIVAIVAATTALWFAVTVSGGRAAVGAAMIMGVAICGMHYVGMSAVRVRLTHVDHPITGLSPFALLAPISIVACVAISALAYATVGFSVRQENAEEEALLERTRSIYAASLSALPSTPALRQGIAPAERSGTADGERSVAALPAAERPSKADRLSAAGRLSAAVGVRRGSVSS